MIRCSSRKQRVGVEPRLACHGGGRLADHVAADEDVADQRAFGRVGGPFRPLLHLAELADVVQDSAGDDQALVQRRLHVGIVVGVLVGQKDARAGDAERVFQQPADVGVMVSPRGRMHQQRLAVGRQQRLDQLAQGGVADVLPGDRQQFVEHLLRIETRAGQQEGRIEAVGGVGVGRLADLADFQLRAEVGLLVGGAELVERARRPAIAAIDGPRRIAPDRKAHLAAGVAEADAKIRLAGLGLQFFLRGHQQKQVGLLAGRHFGERGEGHGGGEGLGIGNFRFEIAGYKRPAAIVRAL